MNEYTQYLPICEEIVFKRSGTLSKGIGFSFPWLSFSLSMLVYVKLSIKPAYPSLFSRVKLNLCCLYLRRDMLINILINQ
jgi:hypothetical protein